MSADAGYSELRKKTLALRRAQSFAERERKSSLIFERWRKALPADTSFGGRLISLYRSMPEEVNLTLFANFLLGEGADVFFPRLASRESAEFELLKVTAETEWKKGVFGFEEPVSEDVLTSPENLDLIFVPGVVFGTKGERIGMGKGHYDRFLTRNQHALRVSLAFDFQCGENIPQSSWDQPMDWVLSEIRDCRGENWSRRIRMLSGSAD